MVKHQCTKLGKNFELCKFYIKKMTYTRKSCHFRSQKESDNEAQDKNRARV